MSEPTDVVIAGTKPFALALFAPVTERAGLRPRIAPEPATALTLCADSSGVLVVEYEPRWLPALTLLRQSRPGLRVVAALPRGQEAAALTLSPLSIESVPWDGRAVSVLPAIERAIGGPGGPTPAQAPVEAPAPAVQADEPPALDLFGDLGARTATPFPASLAAVPPPAPPPGQGPALDLFNEPGATATPAGSPSPRGPIRSLAARTEAAAWPANGPAAAEAELALQGALDGVADASTLGTVAAQVAAGLSPLERAVFAGGAPAVDAGLIRRAAVLRLRVALALATCPPKGTASDGAAVAELLAEIDGLLASVKGLLEGAPAEARVSLEAIRNSLVKEAVDFSEACHEVGTSELPLAPGRATGRAAGARVLSVHAGVDAELPEVRRRRVMPVVTLVVVLALAGGYHAWNLWNAPPKLPPSTFEGAPAGTMALQNGKAYLLVTLPGQKINPAELESYRQREAKRGNQVRQIGPGTWTIEPATAGGAGTP